MRTTLIIPLFLILIISSTNLFSQFLPNYMTEAERQFLPEYVKNITARGFTSPPSSPLRTPAEWEEMQAIVISWQSYLDVLTEIVDAAVDECTVYIVTQYPSYVNNQLVGDGVDVTNVQYIDEPSNSVWIRDYGPTSTYTNDVDSLLMIDWIYNRNRPDDDALSQPVANQIGVPLYETTQAPTDLVATGGNFFTDGFGRAFSSELIVDENEAGNQFNVTAKTVADIETIMEDFMGIDEYILFPTLPHDGIHHIDMHMKMLDEETILLAEYPPGVADGPQIEANLQYLLNNYTSVFGDDFRVVRIPSPPDEYGDYPDAGGYYRTYTNSLIINKKILMPSYDYQYDTTAIRIYEEAMPGYEVVPIDCNSPIHASGAIHCITHEIAVENPLLISHQELRDTNDIWNPYEVNALIKHIDGISSATLYYKTDISASYQSVGMTLTSPSTNTWTGYIPAQSSGTRVYYYIEANAASGKTQVRPLPAPDAYFDFYVYNPTYTNTIDKNNIKINSYNDFSELVVDVFSSKDFTGELVLRDITGRKLKHKSNISFNKGTNSFRFNTSELSSGMYIIRLNDEKSVISKKVLVD